MYKYARTLFAMFAQLFQRAWNGGITVPSPGRHGRYLRAEHAVSNEQVLYCINCLSISVKNLVKRTLYTYMYYM